MILINQIKNITLVSKNINIKNDIIDEFTINLKN